MANNKEEAGKGMPRPGESPAVKRPYATIDVKATEVEGREAAVGSPGAAKPATPASATADPKAAKPEVKAPPGSQPKAAVAPGGSDAKGSKDKSGSPLASLAGRRRAVRLLTHLAAGAIGALIVLGAMHFLAADRQPSQALEVNDLRRRVVLCPCWPGGYGRRSTGHFSVKHLVPFKKSFVPSRRHCLQLGPV